MSRSAQYSPKYRRIFDELHHDIVSGRYRAGQKLPSEAALVKRFGASRITVGRAVRELQQRGLVDRVAGSGTYVRDVTHHAREGLLFGLVIPNLGETEIFEPICRAIAASRDARTHALLWPHADVDPADKEDEALQLCRQCIARGVAGVFFAPLELAPRSGSVNQQVMKMLKEARIPVVLLDRRPEGAAPRDRVDLVGIDNHRAGCVATEHLLRLGSRDVGFIAYKGQASTVKARVAGYREAIGEFEDAHAHVFHLAPGQRLELPPGASSCDAFVCANDRIAGRLMHALLARGVRIPKDVRIAGIDDVNYASLLPVPLTTIRQPCRDIGETALRVMLERLDRPQMPARDVLLDCELVVRESCGGAPQA